MTTEPLVRTRPISPRLGRQALLFLLSSLLLFYLVAPVCWVFSSSVQSEADISSIPPRWITTEPTFHNFNAIFFGVHEQVTYETRRQGDPATGAFIPSGARHLLPSLYNSLKVGLTVAFLNLVLSVTAAFAIARLRFVGRTTSFYTILVTRVIPDIALVVPLFLMLRNLGLSNTLGALIITYLAITLPFTVYILINYFESIPIDLHKAARVDGCSHLQVLQHVYLPLGVPALMASLMFAFLTSWNEFLLALMLTQSDEMKTLPIVISGFVLDFTTSFSFINAAGVIAIVPPVLIALLFERYIVSGLTAGAVKG
ncbi:MAG: carbohydrate ABC transporter permease [Rhodospirillales bacterium]